MENFGPIISNYYDEYKMVFSARDDFLLTALGNRLDVWSTAPWGLLKSFTSHLYDIMQIQISKDGKLIASSGFPAILTLWDLDSGLNVSEKLLERGISALAFSPDAEFLAIALEGAVRNNTILKPSICVYRVKFRRLEMVWRADSALSHSRTSLVFSSNRELLVATGYTIRIWDIMSQQLLGIVGRHENPIIRLVVSYDNMALASMDSHRLKFWGLRSEGMLETNTEELNHRKIRWLGLSGDGKTLTADFSMIIKMALC
ncbi:hypothetical protein H072_3711 [Dactylellina haptotyla CBS 200.50]|uniref:WD repeat-containing protein JIP5 n=1 Tax=Dactylellina haptotyla (strain CBS 200.50) TaxID=1284197 RepID=S8C3U8_DACHA|nr:hypothetical protein H072_3711 [Dactylellina haptotyla CBS 200.50]